MTKKSTVQATTTTLSPILMPALVFCADPLPPHRQDGKDKSGDAAGQAEERYAAAGQSDDGEDESAYGHSRVILLWRRLASGRHRCRLACYYDSSAGGGDGRLVSSSTIVIDGRICLRKELSRSRLVSTFGIFLVILRGSHWVR